MLGAHAYTAKMDTNTSNRVFRPSKALRFQLLVAHVQSRSTCVHSVRFKGKMWGNMTTTTHTCPKKTLLEIHKLFFSNFGRCNCFLVQSRTAYVHSVRFKGKMWGNMTTTTHTCPKRTFWKSISSSFRTLDGAIVCLYNLGPRMFTRSDLRGKCGEI